MEINNVGNSDPSTLLANVEGRFTDQTCHNDHVMLGNIEGVYMDHTGNMNHPTDFNIPKHNMALVNQMRWYF